MALPLEIENIILDMIYFLKHKDGMKITNDIIRKNADLLNAQIVMKCPYCEWVIVTHEQSNRLVNKYCRVEMNCCKDREKIDLLRADYMIGGIQFIEQHIRFGFNYYQCK